jgi:RNA-directed DNA polymerase
MLSVPPEELDRLALLSRKYYAPFKSRSKPRPFQKKGLGSKPRPIDNPLIDLSWVQKRIYRRRLKPICFPEHIFGAIPKRSVVDNVERHVGANLLVTLDVRQCFPSITNCHVYRVWSTLLGCSPPVAKTLTELTTYHRRLPQGASTSPLLANLFIWMIDQPIRSACEEKTVAYSTWIDDLAFSGARAKEMIQVAISTLAAHGLRVKREKIKIMGPRATKVLTGVRLGANGARAPKDKLSRIRSGVHKIRSGLVSSDYEERYILGVVGQLRFIKQICPKDVVPCARELRSISKFHSIDAVSRKFLTSLVEN